MYLSTVIVLGLCWSSFLNCMAHRLVFNKTVSHPRSKCPNCDTSIAWYDLIPLVSFILLRGKCRHCHQKISPLYPLIEFLGGLMFALAWVQFFQGSDLSNPVVLNSIAAHVIFISSLLMAIRTDLEDMVVLRLNTLFPIPLFFGLSYLGCIPATFVDSIIGAFLGYGILWGINSLYKSFAKIQGVGEGDMELLAMIGAFLGAQATLHALTVAALSGCVVSMLLLLLGHISRNQRIPFAPFLAIGAFISYIIPWPL